MSAYDNSPLTEDEIKCVPEVMAFFACNREQAKSIIEASKKNGNLKSIKKICHDCGNAQNNRRV